MIDDDVEATADGVMNCLRMLTDEALLLNLHRTYAALQGALETCQLELASCQVDQTFGPMAMRLSIH